jgi:GNAT superfamily N-acetyltransferase
MALYQKEGVLKDGSRVILRPMVKEDRDKLLDFFHRVDDRDLMFLRNDVRDPATIEDWVNHIDYRGVYPLLAEADGRIVGNATLHMRKVGWKRHLGNVRIVIAKDYQGKGLGTLMVNELIDLAAEFGLGKAHCRNSPPGPRGPDHLQKGGLFRQGGVRGPGGRPLRPKRGFSGDGVQRHGPGMMAPGRGALGFIKFFTENRKLYYCGMGCGTMSALPSWIIRPVSFKDFKARVTLTRWAPTRKPSSSWVRGN